MGRALAIGALLLAGSACGRWEFDAIARTDAAAPDELPPDDAAGGSFSPVDSNCTLAQTGPFTMVAGYPASVGGFGVFVDGPNILMADQGGGLHNLRFDGAAFTRVGHLDFSYAEAVWGDGTRYYVGVPGSGMYVLGASANGDLSILDENEGELVEARKGWSSGGLQFVPAGLAGLAAYRFDGTSLEKVGASLATANFGQGVFAQGDRIYFADNAAFRAVDWTGSGFTETIARAADHPAYGRVWVGHDGVIFAAHTEGLSAYRVVGNALDEVAHFVTPASARDVWFDGAHIFLAAESDGLYALTFANDIFDQVAHVDTGGSTLGVFGDGRYIYTNDFYAGLRAYDGFRCLEAQTF